ncbi:hypothetical protein GLE_2355 [Lysobacter enzymogenes]|uniref:Uncharacterized protein n=1 Tax=Lysobacter enzymogenes TaxID=69 RepID=A0A0S2DH84_LYSEN|nr:hypothetical protein GLE_2355 [Lysobacter enzymogenes]
MEGVERGVGGVGVWGHGERPAGGRCGDGVDMGAIVAPASLRPGGRGRCD